MERNISLGAKIYFWKFNLPLFIAGIATTIVGIIGSIVFILISSNLNGDISQDDYETIIQNGNDESAVVKSITIKKNITSRSLKKPQALY